MGKVRQTEAASAKARDDLATALLASVRKHLADYPGTPVDAWASATAAVRELLALVKNMNPPPGTHRVQWPA